jgi:hypothetical protein
MPSDRKSTYSEDQLDDSKEELDELNDEKIIQEGKVNKVKDDLINIEKLQDKDKERNKDLIIEIDINQEQFPTIELFKNDQLLDGPLPYMPKDKIGISVLGTGEWRATVAILKDIRGQIRYRGRSGGKDHVFETRIQNTKSFGIWNFEIEYPIDDQEIQEVKVVNIPFEIKEYIASEERLDMIQTRDENSGMVFAVEYQSENGMQREMIENNETQIKENTNKISEIEKDEDISNKIHGENLLNDSLNLDTIDSQVSSNYNQSEKLINQMKIFHAFDITLSSIDGFNRSILAKLNHKNIKYVKQFLELTPLEIENITKMSPEIVENWIESIQDLYSMEIEDQKFLKIMKEINAAKNQQIKLKRVLETYESTKSVQILTVLSSGQKNKLIDNDIETLKDLILAPINSIIKLGIVRPVVTQSKKEAQKILDIEDLNLEKLFKHINKYNL